MTRTFCGGSEALPQLARPCQRPRQSASACGLLVALTAALETGSTSRLGSWSSGPSSVDPDLWNRVMSSSALMTYTDYRQQAPA